MRHGRRFPTPIAARAARRCAAGGAVPWLRAQPVRRLASALADRDPDRACCCGRACRRLGRLGACFNAVVRARTPTPARRRAASAPAGASIAEKCRLIIFGRYPFEEQWRPEIATLLLVAPGRGELHAPLLEAVARRCCGSRCWRPSSC